MTLLDSVNRPDRVNQKNLSGLDAITGASNFDIAEHIWLKLIALAAVATPGPGRRDELRRRWNGA